MSAAESKVWKRRRVFLQYEYDAPPQYILLKWLHSPLLLQDVPGHPVKGHWNYCMEVGNMTS